MSWKESTIGDVLSVIKNGINCEQNKNLVGSKITRIETISKKRIDFERVGYANLSESEKLKSQLKVGDILFSHINSPIHVGKTAIYEGEEDIYHGINLLLMRTKEEIDPYFFNHFLNHLFSTGYWEENCKKSVNQASVNQQDISKVPFRYPPLATQQKIVAKLDAIFAEIDKATAAAEANANNAEALFQSYLKQVFDDKKYDYKIAKFGEVASFVRGPFGGSLKKSYFVSSGYAVYEQQHAINNQFSEIRYFIDETKFQEMKRFELSPGDLIMSCSGTMGRIAIAPSNISKGVINQALLKITPVKQISATYLSRFLTSQNFQREIKELSGGAAIQNVPAVSVLKEIKIPVLDLTKQKVIVDLLDDFESYTKELKKSYFDRLAENSSLKNSILNQAFSGELVKA